MERILFIGRFQPFHLGHLSVVKDVIDKCDELIIAIGSSDNSHEEKNPFSYEERKEMIEKALFAEGLDMEKVIILPIPDINNDDAWVDHVQSLTPKFFKVYTGSELTEKLFNKADIEVEPVEFVYDIDATSIRDAALNNKNWGDLVHPKVFEYLQEIDGEKRIRNHRK